MFDPSFRALVQWKTIQMSGHCDVGIFSNCGASVIFYLGFYLGVTWHCVGCSSCTSWKNCNDMCYFCSRPLKRRQTLFCKFSVGARIVFTESPRSTIRFRIFERCPFLIFVRSPKITSFCFSLWSAAMPATCRTSSILCPLLLLHPEFTSFGALEWTVFILNFWLIELLPFFALLSSWSLGGVDPKRFLVHGYPRWKHALSCWILWFRLRYSTASLFPSCKALLLSLGSPTFLAFVNGFLVPSIFRKDVLYASQLSSVIEFVLLDCPFSLFFLLSGDLKFCQSSPDHMCPFGDFSLSELKLRESCPWVWQVSIHIDIPETVSTAFFQDVQICVRNPGHVNAFQWDWECFFFRHVKLKSKFDVMAINEVTLQWPEVIVDFSVIFCFCRLRPLRVSLNVFTNGSPHQRGFSDFHDLFKTILLFHPRSGIYQKFTPFAVITSFALNTRFAKLQGLVHVNDFRLFRKLEEFSFCTEKSESIKWVDLEPRQRIGDCFEIHLPRWGFGDLLFSSHQTFLLEAQRRQCVLCKEPLWFWFANILHISIFWEVCVWTLCFLDTTFAGRSESESWEVLAIAGTSAASRLSVNSSATPRDLASGFPLPLGHIVKRAGLEKVLDESCGNDVEDELALDLEELDDNPGISFLVRCGSWPLAQSNEQPCSSQSFPSDKTAGVSSSKLHNHEQNEILNESLCFLVGMHFTHGNEHHCGDPGFSKAFEFAWTQIFQLKHVHWCSGIDHMFSFLSVFQRGCQHYSCFGKRVKHSPVLIFSLLTCFAKSHALCGRISFGLKGFFLCSFLEFWNNTDLTRITHVHNSLRWTLSFSIFDVVPCALGEFDGVIRSQFPNFPKKWDFPGC